MSEYSLPGQAVERDFADYCELITEAPVFYQFNMVRTVILL